MSTCCTRVRVQVQIPRTYVEEAGVVMCVTSPGHRVSLGDRHGKPLEAFWTASLAFVPKATEA